MLYRDYIPLFPTNHQQDNRQNDMETTLVFRLRGLLWNEGMKKDMKTAGISWVQHLGPSQS